MAGDTVEFARLLVPIETGLDSLKRDLAAAQRALDSTTRTMNESVNKLGRSIKESVGGSLTSLRNQILAIASISFLKSTTSDLLEFADSLGDSADALGINVERLQSLRLAASQSGVSFEEFNKGLSQFQKLIADGRVESNDLTKELQRLGIAIDKTGGGARDGAQVFLEFLDAIRKTSDAGERLRLAGEGFGDRIGRKFVTFANQGTAAILDFEKRAREMGAVVSEQTVKQLGNLNDEFEFLAATIKAKATTALGGFIQTLGNLFSGGASGLRATATLDEIDALIAQIDERRSRIADGIRKLEQQKSEGGLFSFLGITDTQLATEKKNLAELDAQYQALEAQRKAALALQAAPAETSAVSAPPPRRSKEYEDAIKKQIDLERQLTLQLAGFSDDRRTIIKAESAARLQAINEIKGSEQNASKLRALNDQIEEKEFDKLNKEKMRSQREYLDGVQKSLLQARDDKIGLLNFEEKEALASLERQKLDFEDYLKAKTEIERTYELERAAAQKQLDDTRKQALEKQNKEFTKFVDDLSGALAELVVNADASFQEIARAFLKDVIQKIITDVIRSGLLKLLSSLGLAVGGPVGAALSIAATSASASNGKARGGDVTAGRSYLVGERGPEIFQSGRSGRIIPNNQLGGGGNTYVQVNTVERGQNIQTRQTRLPAGDTLVEISLGAVAQSISRSTQVGRAILNKTNARPRLNR